MKDIKPTDNNAEGSTAFKAQKHPAKQSPTKKRFCKSVFPSLKFFPQQGLPQEIRHMVYDQVATIRFREIILRKHWIYYEDNSNASALLRSGNAWENDAGSALGVRRATEAFTLRVH